MSIFDSISQAESHSGSARARGVDVTRTVAPEFNPVTAAQVIAHLKLPSGSSETNIDRIIGAVIGAIEKNTNRGYIKQTIRQTHDQIGAMIKLWVRPVLEVVSIQTIPTMAADDLVLMDSADYAASIDKDKIRPRSAWPSHRGFSSFIVTYNVGYNDHADSPTDEEIVTAQAAVPEDVREAILQWIGHFYNNREGQSGEMKYEVIAKRIGVIPSNVAGLLEGYLDRRLTLS
jgi:uncharacterized phiE125 gp8 family phage protein